MRTIRNTKADGFSVVELIVVVALIAIVSGIGVNLTGVLAGRRAYATSEKLTQLIARTKTDTLAWSRGTAPDEETEADVSLTLLRKSTGIYAVLHVRDEEEETLLNGDRVTMTVFTASGRDESLQGVSSFPVTETETVTLTFDKKTGAFLPQSDGSYVKRIMLQEGDRRYIVRLVPATGYVYVEAGRAPKEEEADEAP